MSEIYQLVYHQAGVYNLETSTYCLFDKVFRNFISRNIKDFLVSGEDNKPKINVGNLCPTDF